MSKLGEKERKELRRRAFESSTAAPRAQYLLNLLTMRVRGSAPRGGEKKPQQVSAGASFWVAKGNQIPNANTAWAICVKIQ